MILDKEEIKKIIPYQEPFLFVHGVEDLKENEISGFYQTSADDYYFQGHFVDFKIMPGVLVVEGMAQLSTVLLRKKIPDDKKYHFLAYNLQGCQFFKPIFPGQRIDLKAEVLGIYDNENYKIARVKSQALVNNELCVQARFSVVIIDKGFFNQKYQK